MKKFLFSILFLFPVLIHAEEFRRTWTTMSGNSIEAVWVRDTNDTQTPDSIRLRTSQGIGIIPLAQLSEADQKYVQFVRFFGTQPIPEEITSENTAPTEKAPTAEFSPEELEAELKKQNFKYTIDSNIVTITKYTRSAASATIPYGVTNIGDGAFSYCTNLTSVKIPDSVTSIEKRAFRGCESLTSVKIPDSIMSIEDSTFHSCESLTSVTIPNSVTCIGEGAFEESGSVTIIGKAGSAAERYAREANIRFQELE